MDDAPFGSLEVDQSSEYLKWNSMSVYRVVRSFHQMEYCNVEASSEEEAINKAIEDNCWEENPNNTFLPYEYIAVKE